MAELIAEPIQTAELESSGYTGQPEGNIDLTENNVQVNVAPYKYATPKIPIQEDVPAVNPSTQEQTIVPSEGFAGMDRVIVNPANLESKRVTPTTEEQTITPQSPAIGFSSVTVAATSPPPVLITKQITENGTYAAEDDNVDGYSEVVVNVPIIDNTGIDLLSLEEHKGYRQSNGSISGNGTDPNWSWFDPVNIGERKTVLYRLWGYTTVMSLMVWNANGAIIDTVHVASGSSYFSGKYTIPNGGTRIAVSCFNTRVRADQICVLI